MSRDQLKRLKELEIENQRLKRVVADLSLNKIILTEATEYSTALGHLFHAHVASHSMTCGHPREVICEATYS